MTCTHDSALNVLWKIAYKKFSHLMISKPRNFEWKNDFSFFIVFVVESLNNTKEEDDD